MRDPDVQGVAGKAWLLGRPDDDPIDTMATICAWLLHVPNAHPFWSWYTFTIVHLRDIPGQKHTPVRRYPEAEYELMIFALDPDSCPDPTDPTTCARVLDPVNVVEQFHGLTDDQARELGRAAVAQICRGRASPDSDARAWWRAAIPFTIEHILTGGHPKAKA